MSQLGAAVAEHQEAYWFSPTVDADDVAWTLLLIVASKLLLLTQHFYHHMNGELDNIG
jgi:hypothetical protein